MTKPDRVHIAIIFVFGLAMVGGLLTLCQTLLEPDRYIPALGALLLLTLYPRLVRTSDMSLGQIVAALGLFLVRPLVSLGAAVSALLLLGLGSRMRLQPLRMPVRVFCWSFVAFFSIDILFAWPLGAATFVELSAWNPFHATLVGWVLGLLPILVAWIALHVGAIIGLSTIVTASEILLERWFRPRISSSTTHSPCVHLSDLHITVEGSPPIEDHGVSVKDLLTVLRSEVAAAEGPIAITGDITDAGTREEWRLALSAIQAGLADNGKAVPVLLVPGNHDLFPYMQEFCPKRSAIGLGSPLVPMRKLRFLEAAARLCPKLSLADEAETLLVDVLSANATALKGFATGENRLKNVVDDLWDSCFPLHCVIGLQAFIILDTNRPAMSFVTAAFGEVAESAWQRLDTLFSRLRSRPGLQVVVLGHHHLYTPLEKRTLWLVKWLEIVSRRNLLHLLSREADFYLHGHRHVAFNFNVERLNIVSAPSLRSRPSA